MCTGGADADADASPLAERKGKGKRERERLETCRLVTREAVVAIDFIAAVTRLALCVCVWHTAVDVRIYSRPKQWK